MTARENVRLGVRKWAKLDGITPDLGVMPQTRRHQRFRCSLELWRGALPRDCVFAFVTALSLKTLSLKVLSLEVLSLELAQA